MVLLYITINLNIGPGKVSFLFSKFSLEYLYVIGMSMWSDKVSLNHLWSCIYILKSIDDPECQKAADQGIG